MSPGLPSGLHNFASGAFMVPTRGFIFDSGPKEVPGHLQVSPSFNHEIGGPSPIIGPLLSGLLFTSVLRVLESAGREFEMGSQAGGPRLMVCP